MDTVSFPLMEGWRSVMKTDVIDWLLEENNPSIQYLTLVERTAG